MPRPPEKNPRLWPFALVGGLLIAVTLLVILGSSPEAWTRSQWALKQSGAKSIRDYDSVAEGCTYEEVVSALGKPDHSGPGFESLGHVDAAVFYWYSDQGEIRGMVIDDRLVGPLKIGEW